MGQGRPIENIARLIQEKRYLHSLIVGYLSDDEENINITDVPRLGNIDTLLSVVDSAGIDHIVVATSEIDVRFMSMLIACMKRKIKVTDFKRFIETVAGKVPIDYLSDSWFFGELSSSDRRYYWYLKRIIDIFLSLFGLCVALAFLPIIALLIKVDSPGPVFYSQMRIGRDNKPFRLWKLRTMVRDAEKSKIFWTTDHDERITRLGKFFRKIRIDEVPQLWNILRGDMTLIGPRPEAVNLVELYRREIPYYQERPMVTPGITGWAQINYSYGNSIEDAREKLMYDYYYIKYRSIILDAIIFLRTIRTVLTGKGAL